MPKQTTRQFKVRMSPDLMKIIDDVRGAKSKNEQINEWLWSKAGGDQADRIANALRPVLASMDESDQAVFADHTISAVAVLAKIRAKKRTSS